MVKHVKNQSTVYRRSDDTKVLRCFNSGVMNFGTLLMNFGELFGQL